MCGEYENGIPSTVLERSKHLIHGSSPYYIHTITMIPIPTVPGPRLASASLPHRQSSRHDLMREVCESWQDSQPLLGSLKLCLLVGIPFDNAASQL